MLGIPGSGKTSFAFGLQKSDFSKYAVLIGNNAAPVFDKSRGMRSTIDWLGLKAMRFGCILLTPITLIVFWPVVSCLIKNSFNKRLSTISNSKFIFLQILSLDYQLLRFFVAKFISRVTKKVVIIDEGFLYNLIRNRTFISPEISEDVNSQMLLVLKKFDIYGLWLQIEPNTALKRFCDREEKNDFKRGEMCIFKLWNIDRSSPDWMKKSWNDFDLWHKDYPLKFGDRICCIDADMPENDMLKNVTSFIEKVRKN